MGNSRKSNRGLSLLEVLVGLICLGAVTAGIMQFIKVRATASISQDSVSALQGAMMESISDVQGKKTSLLPTIGNCQVRYYSQLGDLLTIAAYPITHSECTTVDAGSPDPKRIKIIARFRAPTSVTVNYNPDEFLKLPQYSNTLVEIQFLGSAPGAKSNYHHLRMTIYRKL